MKVALLSDFYLPRLGGLELHLRDLAQALTASGCEVHIVTPTRAAPGEQAHKHLAVSLPHPPGVVVHRLSAPLFPRYRFVYTPAAFRELSALLRREGYDIVHAMVGVVSPASIGGAWMARRMGIPTVVTCHSMLFGFRSVLRALDVLTGWSRWPVLFSAVSGTVAAELQTLVGGRAIRVLPNGVDPGAWHIRPIQGAPGELRLVSVMRLNARKRGGALLRAVARAQRALGDGVRLRLTLVGDGPQAGTLRRLAVRLGLKDAVRFAGYLPREEVRDVYARSDAFVLASRLESFGIAALEARAAGIPVVALEHGGIKEFVRHGREGLLAATDEGLSDHLVRLARSPGLLAELTAGARERPTPFSCDESLARHLSAYRAALAGGETSAGKAASEPAAAGADRSDAA